MKDQLGARMKEQYEDRTRYFLPRRTYTIIRIDGKAFHTLTRVQKCEKPFDEKLMMAMAEAGKYVCSEVQGAQFGYIQSDECSILLTDFSKESSESWFNSNLQKMCSVSASLFTAKFNKIYEPEILAMFDSRIFTIPDPVEVENYFVWRQKDAERNSIISVAQSHYSHKELQGKSCSQMQDMIHEKGDNWNNYKIREKRGLLIEKGLADGFWSINLECPIFTKNPEFFETHIPKWGYNK